MTLEEFKLKLMLIGWDTRKTVFSDAVLITVKYKNIAFPVNQDLKSWDRNIKVQERVNGLIRDTYYTVSKSKDEVTISDYYEKIIEILGENINAEYVYV